MDTVNLTKIFFALLLVVALIGVMAGVARALKLPQKWAGAGNKTKRLEIKEVLYVDAKHKIILLKRDAVEHVLLIGQNDSRVIETNIPTLGSDENVRTVV